MLHRRVLSFDQVLGSLRSESKASESRGSQLSKIPPHIATSDTRSTCRSILDLKAGICHQMWSGGLGENRHCSLERYSWGQKHCLGPFCKMFRFQVFFFFLSHDSKFCWHLTFLGQLSSIRWICGLSSFGFVTCGFVGFVRERGRRGGVGVGACSFNSSFPCFSVRAGPPIREGWDSQLGNYISQFTLARDFLIGTYSRSKKELMHLNAHTEICHSTFWNQSENMVTMIRTWSPLILQSERRLSSCWTESTEARSAWRPRLPPRAPPSAPSLSRCNIAAIYGIKVTCYWKNEPWKKSKWSWILRHPITATNLYHQKLNYFAGGAKSCGGGRPPGWLSDIAPSGRLPPFFFIFLEFELDFEKPAAGWDAPQPCQPARGSSTGSHHARGAGRESQDGKEIS